ncbi:MAG: AAA family ATPase [Gemmatimonadaceae bacterium]
MERRALIVTGGAEPEDVVSSVLSRFGYGPAEWVQSLGVVESRLRGGEHFDLIVVPIHADNPVDMHLLEREIRRGGATHVIGTSQQHDSELILRALRAGVHEFLTLPLKNEEFAEAMDRLARRVAGRKTKEGKFFAVYSAKGGLGTTTVAVNLAAALAQRHTTQRVALADLVVLGGDVRVMLNLKPLYDVGDLVMKVDRVDADLLFSLMSQAGGGLWALPSSDNTEVLELIDAAATTTIVSQLKNHFGYVVADTEHSLSDRALTALDAADRVILVTQLSVTAVRSAQRSLQLFDRLGYENGKVSIVVNRHDAQDALKLSDAENVLGHAIFGKLPNDYRTCSEALTRGVPLTASAPSSQVARAYQALAAKLSGPENDTTDSAQPRTTPSRVTRLFNLRRK